MKISRRDFVVHSSGLLFSLAPFFNTKADLLNIPKTKLADGRNILVLIHLAGGNDWFNTIIPYNDPAYYRQRPTLAIDANRALQLNNEFAFHPALSELKELYDKKEVAILLNHGLSEHDLSHHKAIKQMQYIDTDQSSPKTWRAGFAELTYSELGDQSFPGINVEPLFYRDESVSNDIKSVDKLVFSSLSANNNFEFNTDIHYQIGNKPSNTQGYVEQGFDCALKQIVQLINQKSNTTIYNISLGGFDTHTDQLAQHAYLLRMLSKGIHSFQSDLDKCGLSDRVLTLICSEFGRSFQENDNQGTDHSYLNHVLAIGRSVKGGIYPYFSSLSISIGLASSADLSLGYSPM
jgi:uncharacterized protein (DUF1501 family)